MPSLELVWCLFMTQFQQRGVGQRMERQEEEIHLLQHELALLGAREQQATSIPALHSHYAASYSHAEKFVLP